MNGYTTSDYDAIYKPLDSLVADIGDGSIERLEPVLTADSSLYAIHGGIASDLTRGSSGGPGKSNNISEPGSPSSIRASIYSGRESEVKASAITGKNVQRYTLAIDRYL
ncbi:hypothetical protein M406DRAFT_71409 [Cryphonectria parasitica EP155]|uniref:Uncharacterized protein n=1 Tax=Cryphonectria parasitica (strain ATCC 38755 / EP155) TaxID=660469 RepID=A0A9P4Y8D9_CRYP1|nr:uncharacterized protein M406DRAFT_71409 [Cryphonectria parasitica EP155]KAF3768371.1 hypothetical protein M406DRAFT_71409 [Cryphonectria parasitica EP155]